MPQGFSVWLWTVLGVILPIVYQAFLSHLPGIFKFAVTWAISAVIVILVGVLALHFTTPMQFLLSFGWLVGAMQAVYALAVKPAAKKLGLR